ncbi:hypothetical protein BDM02DRAFT_1064987 [Thelephora ganbajun]|uniref:Uncharacterized protein n=1 Tax=Thelephora ganbajun TaxID=370292 RepID=A0ACB6Z3D4_THEGA|nr:hypothetical protein BDM02DRAFT_1064987 [Thelephora ganbajun]
MKIRSLTYVSTLLYPDSGEVLAGSWCQLRSYIDWRPGYYVYCLLCHIHLAFQVDAPRASFEEFVWIDPLDPSESISSLIPHRLVFKPSSSDSRSLSFSPAWRTWTRLKKHQESTHYFLNAYLRGDVLSRIPVNVVAGTSGFHVELDGSPHTRVERIARAQWSRLPFPVRVFAC